MLHSLNAWLLEHGVSAFSIDVVLKASLLFVAVGIACAVLYRQSAALRHRLWCLAFIGSLVMAPGLLLMPKLALPILESSEPVRLALPDSSIRDSNNGSSNEETTWPTPTVEHAATAMSTGASPPVVDSHITSAPVKLPWALIVWLTGVFVTVVPLFLGWIASSCLMNTTQGIEADQTDWIELLQQSATKLNLRQCVRLYQTRLTLVPMTWGIFRPIVMLPSGSDQWTRSRKQMVLLHELAHIKRSDLLLQLIARIACAVHWFNPLAWYALRRLRIEREQACDDCVVAAGERASDYASELVDIAETHRAPGLTLSVGMANSSHLEGRLAALFDRARSHLPLTRRGARWLWVSTLLIITAVVVVQPVQRMVMADETESQDQAEPSKAKSEVPIGPQANGTWNVETTGNFKVIVLLPDGTPASGAKLLTSIGTADKAFKDKHKSTNNYSCDANGQFDVPLPSSLSLIRIWVQAKGCVPLFSQWWPGKQDDGHLIPQSYTYQLESGVTVGGIVTDEEDRPVSGAKVEVDIAETVGTPSTVQTFSSRRGVSS